MTTIAASPSTESRLGSGHAWWIWILAVAFVVYLFSFQTGYSIVNPSVQKDVGLSVSQVATIAAVYTWVFAICQFFGGALLDRLGSRKVLPISIALVMIGVFVFANAQSYGMLLLSQVILAVGSCTGFVGAGYIGGQWFGMAKFSFMFGLVQVMAALTSAFSVNIFEAVLNLATWRTLFNVWAYWASYFWYWVQSTFEIRSRSPEAWKEESESSLPQ
jgi:MFS family permease